MGAAHVLYLRLASTDRDANSALLLDDHGGRLTSLAYSDRTARRAQYRMADDPSAARELARAFVDGKIANMRVALLRADRRDPGEQRFDIAETLAAARLVLADVSSAEEIMGYEGTATREYFRSWHQEFGENWGFTARERRPPTHPVNAMLSFGYTLLVHESVAACPRPAWNRRWSRREVAELRRKFRELIDAVEDQVRLYPLDDRAVRDRVVLGARGDRGAPGLLDRRVTCTALPSGGPGSLGWRIANPWSEPGCGCGSPKSLPHGPS